MKYLIHEVLEMPTNREEWGNITFDVPRIYTGCSSDFISQVLRYISLDSMNVNNDTLYFTYRNPDAFKIIFITSYGMDGISAEIAEIHIMQKLSEHNHSLLKNPASFVINQRFAKAAVDTYASKMKLDITKGRYLREIETFQKAIASENELKSTLNKIRRQGCSNGVKYFEFKDVIAEDTCAEGEDIELGTLKFKVDFFSI